MNILLYLYRSAATLAMKFTSTAKKCCQSRTDFVVLKKCSKFVDSNFISELFIYEEQVVTRAG